MCNICSLKPEDQSNGADGQALVAMAVQFGANAASVQVPTAVAVTVTHPALPVGLPCTVHSMLEPEPPLLLLLNKDMVQCNEV
jgi:hypothetical protein